MVTSTYENNHPASRASFIPFCSNSYHTEKVDLHKSALSFESRLGLVIPVYRGQTSFSSASINFYEKPMVKIEPTAVDPSKTLDGALLGKNFMLACI